MALQAKDPNWAAINRQAEQSMASQVATVQAVDHAIISAVVELVQEPGGGISDAHVVKGSGYRAFDEYVLHRARKVFLTSMIRRRKGTASRRPAGARCGSSATGPRAWPRCAASGCASSCCACRRARARATRSSTSRPELKHPNLRPVVPGGRWQAGLYAANRGYRSRPGSRQPLVLGAVLPKQ